MSEPVTALIQPRPRDLGGFSVRRVLPAARQRMVGPFIFFDHIGPASFEPGTGIDVRPHPHIGLATVTYLFEGTLDHRDSLGNAVTIEPGAVNWMTAGRGIAHSERTGPAPRAAGHRIHGIQSWVALPRAAEEVEPDFVHYPAASLPRFRRDDADVCMIAGTAWELASPVKTASATLYLDVSLPAGGTLRLPGGHDERAVYVASGNARIGSRALAAGDMALLDASADVVLAAASDVRAIVLGGAAADGPRHIWWNFVSSSTERIELAKRDWAAGRFAKVPGEHEFIPLPET